MLYYCDLDLRSVIGRDDAGICKFVLCWIKMSLRKYKR